MAPLDEAPAYILIEELAEAGARPRKDRWDWHESVAPLRHEYLDDADDDEPEGE